MSHILYPEGTTLQESFLCRNCPFKDEYLYCQRLQEHKTGCLILDSRREK